MVVTIDGYAGSGKSTIARALAKQLSFDYIDAGFIFRALALYLLKTGKSFDQVPSDIDLQFKDSSIFLEGKDVSLEIKSEEVVKKVSKVGGDDKFRSLVYKIERERAKKGDLVVSGRDTGTAVFPNADYKFFVTTSLDVRAERRVKEFESLNQNMTLEEVKESIAKRDEDDKKYGSLVIPKDSMLIDNSEGSVEDKVKMILGAIEINK